MKVHIGPGPRWIGPYQIAETLLFWKELHECEKHDNRIYNLGSWLCGSDEKPSLLLKFCHWLYESRSKKIKVTVEDHDCHDVAHTLSLIILPTLKKFKENMYSAPSVDDEDVPKDLRSTSAPELTEDQKNQGYPDDNYFKRWDYVLDEMIWAFEKHTDQEYDTKFYSGETDMKTVKVEGTEYHTIEYGPNHTFKIDLESRDAMNARMANGRRLFAKYYNSL